MGGEEKFSVMRDLRAYPVSFVRDCTKGADEIDAGPEYSGAFRKLGWREIVLIMG